LRLERPASRGASALSQLVRPSRAALLVAHFALWLAHLRLAS
jgi:hypothetical protein